MRFAWLLVAASGCRAILGIDTPEQPVDARGRDGAITGDGQLDAPMVIVDAPAGAPIAIQGASSDPAGGNSQVTVTLKNPVVKGDLLVIAFGALDSGTATIASDTVGTSFSPAIATTVSGSLSEGMLYGFAADDGVDKITVMFASSQSFPDVRVGEYRGVSQLSPIDVTTGNAGTSNDCNATLTTHNPNDLLVAANLSPNFVTGPGSGFDARTLSEPDEDILEDRIAVTPGQYTAHAPLQASVSWVMQLVAFSPQ